MSDKIFLPEIKLYRIINTLLDYVRQDLKFNKNILTKSYLYQLFGEESYEKFNLFKNGIEILSKQNKNNRFLEVCIGYNLQRSALPTIHIIIPSESKGQTDGLGYDSDENENVYNDGTNIREARKRSFQCTYNLLLSSDNMGEILFIFHLLQSLFIGAVEYLENDGFENIQINMQDITLQQDLIPIGIYHRILGLNFNYSTIVPSIDSSIIKIIESIEFDADYGYLSTTSTTSTSTTSTSSTTTTTTLNESFDYNLDLDFIN